MEVGKYYAKARSNQQDGIIAAYEYLKKRHPKEYDIQFNFFSNSASIVILHRGIRITEIIP